MMCYKELFGIEKRRTGSVSEKDEEPEEGIQHVTETAETDE